MQCDRISSVPVGPVVIGGGAPLVLIAGPCVIESEQSALETAFCLAKLGEELGLPVIFKASYDKANRTSLDGFRGPGLQEGLRILSRVRAESGLPVLTDVHTVEEISPAAEAVDMLQIPAFLSRQTDLLVAAALSGLPMNIKKGQFAAPDEIGYAVAKAVLNGNRRVTVTDRGVSFGYNNLISDMRAIPVMQQYAPVVYDATHSVQRPGCGGRTGGDRRFIPPLARAAVAAGCDALFMEVHRDPDRALSDSGTVFPLDELPGLMRLLIDIAALLRKETAVD